MALEELARNVTPEFESDLKWAGNSIYSGSMDTVTILKWR